MRHQGKISDWKDDQGFGFITPNGGGQRVFVHINSFSSRQKRPLGDEIVTYELRPDARRRPQADSVAFVGNDRPPAYPSGQGNIPLMLTLPLLPLLEDRPWLARCRLQ